MPCTLLAANGESQRNSRNSSFTNTRNCRASTAGRYLCVSPECGVYSRFTHRERSVSRVECSHRKSSRLSCARLLPSWSHLSGPFCSDARTCCMATRTIAKLRPIVQHTLKYHEVVHCVRVKQHRCLDKQTHNYLLYTCASGLLFCSSENPDAYPSPRLHNSHHALYLGHNLPRLAPRIPSRFSFVPHTHANHSH